LNLNVVYRQDVAEFIEHYGTKGMKWGVRKKSSPRKESSDFKKTVPLRNRKTHELTNKQIKEVNERLNLETNYKRLNPSSVQRGKMAVAGILATATMATTAYNLFNSPAGKHLLSLGKKRAKQLSLF
jgi:hypothetical protein